MTKVGSRKRWRSIAAVVAPIAAGLPKRVLVDHAGAGIHEVASW